MRITPDPFGSPSASSKRTTPSCSSTSLNTLVKASPKPQGTTNPAIKAAARPASMHKLQSQPPLSKSTEEEGQDALVANKINVQGNTENENTASTVDVELSVSFQPPETLSSPETLLNGNNNKNCKRNSNSNSSSNSNSNIISQPSLKVNTVQRPLWRSQSSYALVSPNQLEGIVIESLKTPTTTTNTKLHHHQPPSSLSSSSASDSKDILNGYDNSSTYNHNLGIAFEPNSPDQKGVPWMLYRQRSQSTGAISSSSLSSSHLAQPGVGAMMAAGAAANMIASAIGSHVRSATGSQERHQQHHQQKLFSAKSIDTPLGSTFGIDALYNQPFPTPSVVVAATLVEKDVEVVEMEANAAVDDVTKEPEPNNIGGPWSDEDEPLSSVSTDTEVELDSGVDDHTGSLHVHRPARRTNSTRTGGKSHYSAYRRRIQSISQLQQLQLEQQQQDENRQQQPQPQPQQQHGHEINIYDTHLNLDGSLSSILAVSTASLATAKRNVQDLDGTHSMHFFNRHLQRVREQTHGGNGKHGRRPQGHAMDASSTSIFSNGTLSPASCTTTTSIHSALTATSEISYASSASGFTAITGTTSSSVYALSSSDPSEMSITRTTTTVSETSTLCGAAAATSTSSNSGKAPLHTQGVRRFIRWTIPDISLSRSQGVANQSTTLSSRPTSTTLTPPPRVLRRNGKKGPKRPDAKAFFSNERTYMHWIKFGLLLGSMAMTLLSFGKAMGLQVGLFLVLVAMSTLVYATTIFHLRDRWMKQFRLDVLYYDRIGPSVLFMALFIAFSTNVVLSVLKLMGEDGNDDDGLNFYNGHLDI
ncbi:hypothetical protein BGZ95_002748 [Linnemannia exigua]|uniref:DUF202 domain-containing protein n=1 Tax=Linnemannia exigua TaxID=604196 RepID=A0AAD4DLU5_9FUNG|nr:hypothetical protein BGZ95_002748 [Linnemannia exigua]